MAKLTILALLTLCALASAAFAQKSKSEFNFLNPTPTNQMRETNTDRPDKTEGPYTVDAGHVQIEMDLANYSYDPRTGKLMRGNVRRPTRFLVLREGRLVFEGSQAELHASTDPYVSKFVRKKHTPDQRTESESSNRRDAEDVLGTLYHR